jgi:hypothetical protein
MLALDLTATIRSQASGGLCLSGPACAPAPGPRPRPTPDARVSELEWLMHLACVPLALLFLLGFGFIVNEEFFKGTAAFALHPNAD